MSIDSKPKCHPGRNVINIFSRRTLLEKFSGKEVRIGYARGEVAGNAPLQQSLGLAANITGGTAVAGANQLERIVVDAVASAFAPEEIPIADKREASGQLLFDTGMNVDDIGRTEEACFTKIRPLREQCVEGIEIWVIRIPVAAGDVSLEEKAWVQWKSPGASCFMNTKLTLKGKS